MKKLLICILLLSMVISSAACNKTAGGTATSDTNESVQSENSDTETSQSTENNSDNNGTESIGETESEITDESSEKPEDSEATEPESESTPSQKDEQETLLTGENAAIIENAQKLANGIQTYYTTPDRASYTVQNKNMILEYLLSGEKDQMVSSIKNTKGNPYLTDSMDVFITTTNGNKYYASASLEQTRVNLYRFGYYYYDVHFLEQDFIGEYKVDSSVDVDINNFQKYKDVAEPIISDGVLTSKVISAADPQVYNSIDVYDASKYNNLQFSFKSGCTGSLSVYIITGNETTHNDAQVVTVEAVSDNEWHTYNIDLNARNYPGFGGEIKSIRIDVGGIVNGEFSLKDVKLQKVSYSSIPVSLDRTFHAFPDKLHHEVHIVAYEDTDKIDQIGIETGFEIDTVSKLVFKNKNGLTEFDVASASMSEISKLIKDTDWESCEYIGLDIIDAGIFGYILPYDGESGSLKLTITKGKLTIVQTDSPEGGIIKAPVNNTTNDFRMGHRLYTDEAHDFKAFLHEAECERNPLGSDNIKIDNTKMRRGAKFKGYDAIRGVYAITLPGPTSFNDPYYKNQNLYYNASFSITADKYDREIYVMAYTYSGILECATILDENDLLLPIDLQVSKNFSEKEEPFYNCGDSTYGEVFFPAVVNAGESKYFTVLDIYQDWGNFPLKQLSSIGYYMPYYHLSTGTTETNCISPWYNRGKNLWTLPDHRPMSMPASSDLKNQYPAYGNQPQRPNAGFNYFLQYTDADGNYFASDYVNNEILSYGPTYADVVMNYISDDGKIKASIRHMEMPQVDENRGYYEITYEVLDTLVINNFRDDFSFYTMTGFRKYSKVGFLNKTNTPLIRGINENSSKPAAIVLGDECPYFSLFYMPNVSVYANLSFIIRDSEIIIGGKKVDENFVIIDENYTLRLSLNIPEKVTLQAGDKFTINAIIMPWGGGWIDDNDVQLHKTEDTNVQNVRLNSCLNPFVAAPVTDAADCEAVDSVFLPRVKSTNGKSATFTISGGYDIDPESADVINMTLRVDGLDKLGKLKVEELVNGTWVPYELSTVNSPDSSGNSASFDGYAVHYEGDGTYGYSFVAAFTDGNSRTFRAYVE